METFRVQHEYFKVHVAMCEAWYVTLKSDLMSPPLRADVAKAQLSEACHSEEFMAWLGKVVAVDSLKLTSVPKFPLTVSGLRAISQEAETAQSLSNQSNKIETLDLPQTIRFLEHVLDFCKSLCTLPSEPFLRLLSSLHEHLCSKILGELERLQLPVPSDGVKCKEYEHTMLAIRALDTSEAEILDLTKACPWVNDWKHGLIEDFQNLLLWCVINDT